MESLTPFLRWAGGKRWLSTLLQALVADQPFRRYYEPFLGGGAAFFAIRPAGRAVLSDANAELIETWAAVKESPDEVAANLRRYKNDAASYYQARASRPRKATTRAARFIYLNHTSFNGIYRVNLDGQYNVPYGRRKFTGTPTAQILERVALALSGATLVAGDFSTTLRSARRGDLCFLDPPYTVAHNNNGFIKYNQRLFSIDDQRRLAETVESLNARGVAFVLTNAAHRAVDEMFSPLGRSIEVYRKNVVGGSSATRGVAAEMLYTNIGTSIQVG